MENLIGFLIILFSIIISIISSVRKSKNKNESFASQTDENENQSTWNDEFFRNEGDSEEKINTERSFEGEKYRDDEKDEEREEETYEQEADREKEKVAREEDEKAKIIGENDTILKEYHRKKKRQKTHRHDPVKEIQKNFDVEKAIIYSEIINRKYF